MCSAWRTRNCRVTASVADGFGSEAPALQIQRIDEQDTEEVLEARSALVGESNET